MIIEELNKDYSVILTYVGNSLKIALNSVPKYSHKFAVNSILNATNAVYKIN